MISQSGLWHNSGTSRLGYRQPRKISSFGPVGPQSLRLFLADKRSTKLVENAQEVRLISILPHPQSKPKGF